jgi:O-antigen/teichoic acid export membrane protein
MIAKIKNLLFNNINNRQIFFKNSFWRLAGVLPNKLIRLAIVLLAARELGPTLFGEYNYAVALVSLAFIVSDWGINILLVRDYQQQSDKKMVVASSLIGRLGILALTMLAALIILLISPDKNHLLIPGIIIALTFFAGHLKELFSSIFLAAQRAELEAKIFLFDNIISIASFLLVFYFSPNVINFALVYFLINLLVLLLSYLYARRLIVINIRHANWSFLKKLLKNGLPLSLFGILGYIFFSTDQLILKHYLGYTEVGYYALASKVILSLQILPSLINNVILPIISQKINEKANLSLIIKNGVFGLGAGASLLTIIIFFATPWLMPFFGAQYIPTTNLIQWLSLILIPMFMTSLLDHVLIAFNKQAQDFYLTAIAAATNLILSLWLIPQFGLIGAVIASLVSQIINFILTGFWVFKTLKKQ